MNFVMDSRDWRLSNPCYP